MNAVVRWKNGFAVAAGALLLAAGSLALSAPSEAADQRAVPLEGWYSGSVVVNGPLAVGTTADVSGAGNATQLGRLRHSGSAVITSLLPNGFTNVLTETLTAANGDTITLLCTEVATEVSAGVFHGVDSWVVIGGTGRFAGATGSGTAETEVDLRNGTYSKRISGSITAP